MPELKHKKWKLIEGATTRFEMSRVVAADNEEYVVGYVMTDHANLAARAEDMVNARAFALAPEMLSELEETASWCEERAIYLRKQDLKDEAARHEGRAVLLRLLISKVKGP